jgi:hypothetical protein
MDRVKAVRRDLRSSSLGPDKLWREAAISRSQLHRVLEGEGGVACAYHLSHPDIFVMESAEEWDCCE